MTTREILVNFDTIARFHSDSLSKQCCMSLIHQPPPTTVVNQAAQNN